MARLRGTDISRIGAAVKRTEARKGAERGRENVAARVVMVATITGVVVENVPAGSPKLYTGSILSGAWDDDGYARDVVAVGQPVWCARRLEVGDQVFVLKVGEHWETVSSPVDDPFEGAPDCDDILAYDCDDGKYKPTSLDNLIRYDPETQQLQALKNGVWTMIDGGQAVGFPPWGT